MRHDSSEFRSRVSVINVSNLSIAGSYANLLNPVVTLDALCMIEVYVNLLLEKFQAYQGEYGQTYAISVADGSLKELQNFFKRVAAREYLKYRALAVDGQDQVTRHVAACVLLALRGSIAAATSCFQILTGLYPDSALLLREFANFSIQFYGNFHVALRLYGRANEIKYSEQNLADMVQCLAAMGQVQAAALLGQDVPGLLEGVETVDSTDLHPPVVM